MRSVASMACAALALTGCSYTHIERDADGSFSYTSTRDTSIDALRAERSAGGGFIFEVNGASGSASPVIDAQAEFVRTLFQAAFEAGRRAAVAGSPIE